MRGTNGFTILNLLNSFGKGRLLFSCSYQVEHHHQVIFHPLGSLNKAKNEKNKWAGTRAVLCFPGAFISSCLVR
jgi:hypothetical protein